LFLGLELGSFLLHSLDLGQGYFRCGVRCDDVVDYREVTLALVTFEVLLRRQLQIVGVHPVPVELIQAGFEDAAGIRLSLSRSLCLGASTFSLCVLPVSVCPSRCLELRLAFRLACCCICRLALSLRLLLQPASVRGLLVASRLLAATA
jgi:hypothetical protein